MTLIRVVIPAHLRTIAKVSGEVELELDGAVTIAAVLDALEAKFPALQGTIRDHVTRQRRPSIRYFACSEDMSHDPPQTPLPDAVRNATEPFLIIGAIAGGKS